MKIIRIPALLLAAALQLLPMCRTVPTSPAFCSTLAIIFRWTLGATATFGAFDAVSGGSQVYFDSPGTAVGTVGVPFTYFITLGGTVGTDGGSIVAAAPLPTGFTNYTVSHITSSPTAEWGVISGTPTATMTNFIINLAASNPSYQSGVPVTGSLRLTIYPTSTPVVLTTNPTNVTATNGQTVSFSVVATGSGPLAYQWFKGDTNIYNHIQSATNATYSFKASTNTASGSFAVNAGNYLVRVAGAAGLVSSSPAALIFGSGTVAPTISVQPTNRTVTAGLPSTFVVAAGGTAPLSYQWRKNNTVISAFATNASLALANVSSTDAGSYSVVVTNSAGSLTSSNAQLTVSFPSAPALSAPARAGNNFLFTFTPVVGLTNSVLTSGTLGGPGWSVFTNIPPPATAASITVTDVISGTSQFYRVSISP